VRDLTLTIIYMKRRCVRRIAAKPGPSRADNMPVMQLDDFIKELWGYAEEVPAEQHPWFDGILKHRWTREHTSALVAISVTFATIRRAVS
jgi:hypothetical protein